MTQRPRKALIIGAGIAGPIAAILLRHAGIETHVFEAWPHSTGAGSGLQIAPNGMRVLAELGLAPDLIRRGAICESIDFYSQSGAPLGSVNRNMAERFGQPSVSLRRAVLNEAIIGKAWSSNVELYFEKRLARIEDRPNQPIVAHFTDGSSAEGDFLIGADGVHSAVREHVVPDAPKPFDTGLLGFGGFVPRSLLEAAGARASLAMTFGRSGFFGFGYCGPEPRDGAMCWSTQPAHGVDAATFRAMDQAALRQHLQGFHAGWHDPIPQLIDSLEEIVVTATLDVAALPTWSRGRMLLIGDAAHATSPHAGQGASIALEDAYRLARALRSEDEIGIAFQNFEAERRPRAERVVALARRNGNQKREFGATGAWIRDRMIKVLTPFTARSWDWIYDYDVRAVTAPPQMSGRHDRRAA
ncbi:FAD-dependent monooxygenase [Bradyrhizobium sp.]|uniref:FAD-dependent monooxygenase n=1 Tax=Bradyrhizobium sp. TaxID=376 RepID=UPI001EC771FD|nr:FAD-dependent monooxygenase [Bradyrhizobium sp.]MBV8922381.1 FAD-dependent monooxygenase [Bradyrhizobium sp.]MBV9985627.1 FAD-dependent monooxygenase [Bradyrhizobium sp.]